MMIEKNNDTIIKWSIIIPHYNQPQLLDRLLFSIPTRNDMEVIVVDDCSDLEFKEPLEIIKQKYPQYYFITTEIRGGGGLARNIGLTKAKGEYVIFADSDDFFLPYFNNILNKYENTHIDVIFFNIISLDSKTGDFCVRNIHIDKYIRLYYNKQNDLPLRYLFGEPWARIIRRGLIVDNAIYFDTLPIHNDTTFSYLVGHYAKTIIVENVRAYCLTYRMGSVSNTISWERLEVRLNVFSKKYLFFKAHNIPLFDTLLITPFWFCIKKRDYMQFNKFMRIVQGYGISKMFIYSRLFIYISLLIGNKIKVLL